MKDLSEKERNHVVETLMLCTSYAAAKRLGVPRDNITSLLADPHIARDIAAARKKLIENSANLLIKARSVAIKKLVKWVKDEKMAMSYRLEAACKLLDSSWSFLEKEEVHDKLLAIEQHIREHGA